jgi:asparagine synthase (glutamine-hydrolysing)
MKIRQERGNGVVTKYILRKVAGRYLDRDVVQRPKKGFCLPEERWFTNGKLEVVEELLTGQDSRVGTLFRPAEVRKLIRAHGMSGSGSRIWALWALREWLDQHPRLTVG